MDLFGLYFLSVTSGCVHFFSVMEIFLSAPTWLCIWISQSCSHPELQTAVDIVRLSLWVTIILLSSDPGSRWWLLSDTLWCPLFAAVYIMISSAWRSHRHIHHVMCAPLELMHFVYLHIHHDVLHSRLTQTWVILLKEVCLEEHGSTCKDSFMFPVSCLRKQTLDADNPVFVELSP